MLHNSMDCLSQEKASSRLCPCGYVSSSCLLAPLGFFGTSEQDDGDLSYTCKADTCSVSGLELCIVASGREA